MRCAVFERELTKEKPREKLRVRERLRERDRVKERVKGRTRRRMNVQEIMGLSKSLLSVVAVRASVL